MRGKFLSALTEIFSSENQFCQHCDFVLAIYRLERIDIRGVAKDNRMKFSKK